MDFHQKRSHFGFRGGGFFFQQKYFIFLRISENESLEFG